MTRLKTSAILNSVFPCAEVHMARISPELHAWYQDVEEDALFEVVAIDEDEDYIEVQYLNGEIGEFDFDVWKQMIILPAEAPEDWSAPFEISAGDEYAGDGAGFSLSSWDEPGTYSDSEP
ncbi:MAG TPA: hypothetical protein DCF62_01040 [Porticoccaceae bacterium]|nr:hypothetical protein [Porticoccaceae bacterium]